MLTSRNLRSRLILEESNELKRNDKFSTKFESDEKKNQLMISDPETLNKLNDGGIIKSLRSYSLINSTNKAVRSIGNKKNSMHKKNTLEKFSENENIQERKCRKQSVKQGNLCENKSILKENNFDGKGNKPVRSFLRKQKRIIKHVDLKDIKFKECKNSNKKIKSSKITINCYSDKCVSQQNINKMKNSETEANIVKCVSNIPIWKRELDLNKSNCRKKRNALVDVYDIALDEDLIASEMEIQKKKICQPKKIKKRNRLIHLTKNQNCKNKHPACDTLHSIKKIPTIESDKTTSNDVDIKLLIKENKNNLPLVQNMAIEQSIEPKLVENTDIPNSCLHEENTRENPFLSASAQISDQNEIFEQSEFDVQSTQSELQSNKLLLDLADELEKSFMIPKMTSTPDGVQVQKSGALNVANVSNISTTNKDYLNITVATPYDSVCQNLLQKDVGEEIIGDLTLFESPAKEEKKDKEIKWKSPKKLIQVNLFGEFVTAPINEHNLEESVLKPKKAYHSPDSLKIHLARTKRTDVCKKDIKKSKEQLLIQKMTQHFDEVGDTELCIE